jgi:hypothetical protein
MLTWQEIESDYCGNNRPYMITERAELPHGWLVRLTLYTWEHTVINSSLTFVPKSDVQFLDQNKLYW